MKYLIHPEISFNIAMRAQELRCIPIVESVRKLSVYDGHKYRLYERGVLPYNDPRRLCHHHVEEIKRMLREVSTFYELNYTEAQWNRIVDCINHRHVFLMAIEKRIEADLKPKQPLGNAWMA